MKSPVKFSSALACCALCCRVRSGRIRFTRTLATPIPTARACITAGPGDTRPLSLSITFDVPLAGDQLDNLPIGEVPFSSFSFTDGTGLYINTVELFRLSPSPISHDCHRAYRRHNRLEHRGPGARSICVAVRACPHSHSRPYIRILRLATSLILNLFPVVAF